VSRVTVRTNPSADGTGVRSSHGEGASNGLDMREVPANVSTHPCDRLLKRDLQRCIDLALDYNRIKSTASRRVATPLSRRTR
jgi:hypothetical protein